MSMDFCGGAGDVGGVGDYRPNGCSTDDLIDERKGGGGTGLKTGNLPLGNRGFLSASE